MAPDLDPVATHEVALSSRAPGGSDTRGHLIVDLVASLEHDMHVVGGVFPSAGPLACPPPSPLVDRAGGLEGRVGDELIEVLQRWIRRRRRFQEAAGALEELDHTARHLGERERHILTVRLHEVRDARQDLEAVSAELREALAREVDHLPGGTP